MARRLHGESSMAKQVGPTRYFHATLDDGRHIQFFVNVETGLLVVDVVDADEQGGVEIMRRKA